MLMPLVRLLQDPSARLACLVIGLCLVGGSPAAAQQESRLVVEARAIQSGGPRHRQSWQIDRSWDSRPVLAETAKRHLKLALHADLVVSEPPATPMQIIDPAGRDADAFCTSEDRNAAWQAMITAMPHGDDGVIRLTSVSYGFPVFNAGFTRAAIVVQQFSETWRRAADGTPRRSIEAAGGAVIYAKRAGVWKRIDYDTYFTAH
jgi:hypothetical protein